MKKFILITIMLIVWLTSAITNKYNERKHSKQKITTERQADSDKTPSKIVHMDDRRKEIIQSNLNSAQIIEISKPFFFNLQKPEYGLDKGDLVEFISVNYVDNQQNKQIAIFAFNGSKLLSVKK